MDCQYCRRDEHEYCPNRNNDGDECSPPKKRDADEVSNESTATHASHEDDTSEHEEVIVKAASRLKTVLKRKLIPRLH